MTVAASLKDVTVVALLFIGVGASEALRSAQPDECVPFSSEGRLLAGEVFQFRVPRGLEFVLADDRGAWAMVIRPIDERNVNYLDVTPPLQTRPHAYIGPRYMDARQSVGFPRDVRFVTTRDDYDAARQAIAAYRHPPYDAGAALEKLDSLMKGRLLLKIEDHSLREEPERDRKSETLDWVSFTGRVCVPAIP